MAVAPTARVTLPRVIRSEWIKLRSLRSTVVTLTLAALVIVGLGLLISAVNAGDISTPDGGGAPPGPSTDPVDVSLAGVNLATLVIAVLGVLLMAGEYSTGMIRSSMAAVPRRLPVLWGKAVAFAGVAFPVLLAAATVAFLGGQAIIGDAGAGLSDDGVPRALAGSAAYLTGIGLLGIALGAILRNTAGAIAVLVGVLLVLPVLTGLLPASWSESVNPYLPSSAASAFMSVQPADYLLGAGAGAALFAGYVVVALGAAACCCAAATSDPRHAPDEGAGRDPAPSSAALPGRRRPPRGHTDHARPPGWHGARTTGGMEATPPGTVTRL